MTFDLKGMAAVVTDGTSGIGAETARVLACSGATVMIVGRRQDAAQRIVDGILDTEGRADFVLGDVGDPPGFVARAVANTVARFGRLDILANAAGAISRENAERTTDSEWRTIMAVNVDGMFYMSRAAIPELRRAGGGGSSNLGSTAGMVGASGKVSKGAVVNLTRAMALDHAAENIRINSVNPGAVDTPMLSSGRSDADPKAVRESNREAIPQGWLPAASEVVNTIAFLASDLSRHITGATLPVDGGYTAA